MRKFTYVLLVVFLFNPKLANARRSSGPTLSSPTVSSITSNSVVISFTGTASGNGGVSYGTTSALGTNSAWVSQASTHFLYTLTGLTPSTTYYYNIWEAVASTGGSVTSGQEYTFTTASASSSSSSSSGSTARSVLLQPFASNSIWNMPVGSGAVYQAANITPPTNVTVDEDVIILTPTAPLVPAYTNQAGWQSGATDRCDSSLWPNTPAGFNVPIPSAFVLNQSMPGLSGTPNFSGAILAPDGQTLIQPQPAQVCAAGGPLTFLNGALYPQNGSAAGNIYTDGIAGSHGGSGLSALGGTIRVGELMPGNSTVVPGVASPITHALKFEFNTDVFAKFGQGPFWPAVQADGASEGLLVALPPSFNINSLSTVPARSIAWTLINYGAYIVDNSGWDAVQICTEIGTTTNAGTLNRAATQFQSAWGYSFTQNGTGTAWGKDIATIMSNLQVVTNNGANSVGGGGTPRQPLLPPVTAP